MDIQRKILYEEISKKLTWLCTHIEVNSGCNLQDTNIFAENIFANLLNVMYGYELVNSNNGGSSDTIDLIDAKNKVSIQVTSNKTAKKIKDTIAAFKTKLIFQQGYSLRFIILTTNKKYKTIPNETFFNFSSDILTIKKLLETIKNILEIGKLQELAKVVNEEIVTNTSYECWNKVDFNNQCGIEHAIAGQGLNQNHVLCCPQLPIFNEAYETLERLNSVNIIGESGSGKSLTAFQLAYKYSLTGYTCFVYNAAASKTISLPKEKAIILIIDNAHLCERIVEQVLPQANKDIKCISVFTDSADIEKSGVRISAKQAVKVLYEHYRTNASQIFPIAKKFNSKLGNNFGEVSFSWILDKARQQINPYYFNYVLRGEADYIKEKIDTYQTEGFGEALTVISLYQWLNADRCIPLETFQTILNANNIVLPTTFKNRLIDTDKIVVRDNTGYKISHLHTALNYFKCYHLKSYDNQTIANSVFMYIFNNNLYSMQGMWWFVNSVGSWHSARFSTDKHCFGLFSQTEIEMIFDELHKRKYEPHFLGVIERLDYYCKIKVAERVKDYIEVINNSTIESLVSVSEYINSLINRGRYDKYKALKETQNGIDYEKLLKLFNNAKVDDLIYFARFFERLRFYFGDWQNKVVKHIDVNKFIIKMKNTPIESLFGIVELASAFHDYDNDNCRIRNTCIEVICGFLKANPIEAWEHIKEHSLYPFFAHDTFVSSRIKVTERHNAARKKFVESIDINVLATSIQTNILNSWQSVSELMGAIYIFNKKTYFEIIGKIDKDVLSSSIINLWQSEQQFDIFHTFKAAPHFILELIKMNNEVIQEIDYSILFFSPDAALYLYNKGKQFNLTYTRNDYLFVDGLMRLSKKNSPLTANLIYKYKEKVFEFINHILIDSPRENTHKKLKITFHKFLTSIQDELHKTELKIDEIETMLNLNDYNFKKQEVYNKKKTKKAEN